MVYILALIYALVSPHLFPHYLLISQPLIYTLVLSTNRFTAHGEQSRCCIIFLNVFIFSIYEDELIDLLQLVGDSFFKKITEKWRGY